MRAFIAVKIPEAARDSLSSMKRLFGPEAGDLRFVKKENIHLTLKFLGEISDKAADSAVAAFSGIKFWNFSFSVKNIGFFPNERTARVVWAGIYPEEDAIELQRKVDSALEKHGLFRRESGYKPHITIARVKSSCETEKFAGALKNADFSGADVSVSSFFLMKSALAAGGPVYEEISEFKAQPL